MSMIDVIRKEMMTAMKNKDKERKESLSMLLSALKNAQIDKREDLTEAEENTIIAKEIKQTKETMDTCPADRTDIIDECKARLAVLEEFAPEQMSEEQIEAEIMFNPARFREILCEFPLCNAAHFSFFIEQDTSVTCCSCVQCHYILSHTLFPPLIKIAALHVL